MLLRGLGPGFRRAAPALGVLRRSAVTAAALVVVLALSGSQIPDDSDLTITLDPRGPSGTPELGLFVTPDPPPAIAAPGITGSTGACLLYTSPSPRDQRGSRMPSSA